MWRYALVLLATLWIVLAAVVVGQWRRQPAVKQRHLATLHPAVHLATTRHVDLVRPPAMVDDVLCARGQRILVKDQRQPTQNGIYVVGKDPTQPWQRAADGRPSHTGSWVMVTHGSQHARTVWSWVLHEGRSGPWADVPYVEFRQAWADVLPQPTQRGLLGWDQGSLRWLPPPDAAVVEDVVRPLQCLVPPSSGPPGEWVCRVGTEDAWCVVRVVVGPQGRWVCDPDSYLTQGASPPALDAQLVLQAQEPQPVRWERVH